MKQAQKDILETLNGQDQPRYASWLINRNWRKYGLFDTKEFTAEFIVSMVKDGLISEVIHKSRSMYEITSAGRLALIEPEEKPLEIVPPRQISFQPWNGRMQWDTASERGCHRGIGSVGVAC